MRDFRIYKGMAVADLINRYPQAEEVLQKFSINLQDIDTQQTLEEVCKAKDVDIDELVDTLTDLLDEDYSDFSEVDEE